jgi:predicted phosphodiesterase
MNPIAVDAAKWTRKRLTAESMKYLKGLPERLEIECKGKRIVVVHGSPAEPLQEYVFPWVPDHVFEGFLKETGADVLILGHTHVPFVKRLNGRLVLNPGSVGQPRDHNRQASHAVIDMKRMDARIIRTEYDIMKVSDEIVDAGLPTFLAERLFSGM